MQAGAESMALMLRHGNIHKETEQKQNGNYTLVCLYFQADKLVVRGPAKQSEPFMQASINRLLPTRMCSRSQWIPVIIQSDPPFLCHCLPNKE
jgi:hypothetical protein